jgi:stearoyl-CoA desaturase (delta-9 desaturase)
MGLSGNQVDMTKWVIWACGFVGLARDLKRFRYNEIAKARLQQRLKQVEEEKRRLDWGLPLEELPIVDWDEFQGRVGKGQWLVVVEGVVHDLEGFLAEHPGGEAAISVMRGKDATSLFNGGVYDHSRAARHLLATMRVAPLRGGGELELCTS